MPRLTYFLFCLLTLPCALNAETLTYKSYVEGKGLVETKRVEDGKVTYLNGAKPGFGAGDGRWFVDVGSGLAFVKSQSHNVTLLNTGLVNVKESYNPALGVGLRGGYQWSKFIGELELAYSNIKINEFKAAGFTFTGINGSAKSTAFMVNGLYEFWSNETLAFSGGMGLGLVNLRRKAEFTLVGVGNLSAKNSSTRFAYQLLLNGTYKFVDRVHFLLRYRLFSFAKKTHGAAGIITQPYKEPTAYVSTVELGVRVWF